MSGRCSLGCRKSVSVITGKVFDGSRGLLRAVSGLSAKALWVLDYALTGCVLFVFLLENSSTMQMQDLEHGEENNGRVCLLSLP